GQAVGVDLPHTTRTPTRERPFGLYPREGVLPGLGVRLRDRLPGGRVTQAPQHADRLRRREDEVVSGHGLAGLLTALGQPCRHVLLRQLARAALLGALLLRQCAGDGPPDQVPLDTRFG